MSIFIVSLRAGRGEVGFKLPLLGGGQGGKVFPSKLHSRKVLAIKSRLFMGFSRLGISRPMFLPSPLQISMTRWGR